MSEPLLIVGASGRAAAESAQRAGFDPLVVDAFGDDDTRRVALCRVAAEYPRDLAAEAERLPPADWVYVGGLENSPAIVERLAERRRLLGIRGPALRDVRDPWVLRILPAVDGVRFPEIRKESFGIPHDETWLTKSRRSAGGLGVALFNANAEYQFDQNRYFERHVLGPTCGATFLANGAEAQLLGVVEQFAADSDPRRPFLFGGAVGPIDLADTLRLRLENMGRQAASRFGLCGLFGIDFVLDHDQVWMLEFNPRYTASVELLEYALDLRLIDDHVRACREQILPERPSPTHPRPFSPKIGKRVVYAGAERAEIADEFTAALWKRRGDGPFPAVADIPTPGSPVEPHAPLATVFAAGADAPQVLDELSALAREIESLFRRTCGPSK